MHANDRILLPDSHLGAQRLHPRLFAPTSRPCGNTTTSATGTGATIVPIPKPPKAGNGFNVRIGIRNDAIQGGALRGAPGDVDWPGVLGQLGRFGPVPAPSAVFSAHLADG
jgi:hypothetical protein